MSAGGGRERHSPYARRPPSTPWFGFFSPLEEAALLVTRAGEHIKTLSDVFEPLVAQAQADGEIRTQLAPERTAEWLARMCLTFALDPADVDDDALVTLFFREHLQGLAP